MTSYVRAPYTLSAHQKPTVGDTKMGFANLDHMGWLKCDGRTVNVSDFRLLFDVIGYTFGGSGTTFTLPDFTGRVAAMAGKPLPVDIYSPRTFAKGDISGAQLHQLTIPELARHNHGVDEELDQVAENNLTGISGEHIHTINDPSHNHGIIDPGHAHDYLGVQSQSAASGLDNVAENDPRPTETTIPSATGITINNNSTGITINTAGLHAHVLNPAGGNIPHNNMQPTLFFGNMFVYCGRANYGGAGELNNNLVGKNFINFPYYTTNNQVL